MRLVAVSGFLLASILSTVAPPSPVLAAAGDLLSTSRTNVNVRANPTTEAPIVVTINPGETIIEQDRRDDWYLVRLPDRDREGWIYAPLLEPVVNLEPPKADPTKSVEPAPGSTVASDPVPALTSKAELPRVAAFDENLVGNPERGETVFYKCGSCHTTVSGIHADGPSLVGVFGRPPALAEGFRYSGAMESFARSGAVWDEATLDRFIQRPTRVVKGTSMPFSGVRDAQDRRDLIAFLQQLTN